MRKIQTQTKSILVLELYRDDNKKPFLLPSSESILLLKENSPIVSFFFFFFFLFLFFCFFSPNFWRFWYHKKAHIFLSYNPCKISRLKSFIWTKLMKRCLVTVLGFSTKVTCTCACNFKKLHARNLVYMHMMSMMKYILYMHKIYVVLQVVMIPASISSLRRALLISRGMPHHLHCKIETQHFHHTELSTYIFSIFIFFYYFLLLLVTARYPLEMLFFIIVLCTSTNIVKQVIENLHAHVQVEWKILLAPRKKYMYLCKCACLKSSTVW